jgi:prephenate dehydrogenase
MRPDSLGVVGLGAVGGSIAWQASLAGTRRVLGFTPRPAEGVAAVRAGAVTDLAPSLRFLVERAEMVVLATPAAVTFRLLPQIARFLAADAVCTDVIPAKEGVVLAARAAGLAQSFAGSHPAVQLRHGGFHSAEPAAFRRALVYVTPAGGDDAPAREVADFWAGVLDADPVILDAADHDAIVAWTRHLPLALSAALARACAVDGPRGVTYGPDARDLSRPALVSGDLVRDVLLLNRRAVLEALDDLGASMGVLERALRDGDARALDAWLAQAAEWRRRIEP